MNAAAKILTTAQAEAVYSAMRALENVNGYLYTVIHGLCVMEHTNGVVQVIGTDKSEDYNSKNAFAAAYGLQQG